MYKLSPFIYFLEKPEYAALYNFVNGQIILCTEPAQRAALLDILNQNISIDNPLFNSLAKNLFIVNDTVNMHDYVKQLYFDSSNESKELSIIMILSEKCNFRCKYCYEEYDSTEMSAETIQGILAFINTQVTEKNYKKLFISWFGGEPTLYKNKIISFMNTLRSTFGETLEISGAMTTNAYLLSATNLVDYYSAGITNYQITIDGFSGTHDKLRILPNGQGTWSQIMDNLQAIYNLHLPNLSIILRINYNQDVFDSICEFILYLRDKFENSFMIHVHPISDLGNTPQGRVDILSTEALHSTEVSLGIFLAENGIRSDFSFRHVLPFGGVCYASFPNSFLIDATGTLRKCTVHLHDSANTVGKITSADTFILDSASLDKWINAELETPLCNGCCLYPFCIQRGCTAAIISGDNNCHFNKDAAFAYVNAMINFAYERQQKVEH